MLDHVIVTQGLTKTYKLADGTTVEALRGIDLSVKQGEIYALLGPNGAGKTTTISILITLLAPTSGKATVAGYDVVDQPGHVRRNIGVTFQEVVLDQDLTGRQVLDFHGRLYGLKRQISNERIDELGELVELTSDLDRAASSYSGGMKRRLELARGLMTRPRILFLDEPTQGLDPQNRYGIWRYIKRLRDEEGITIFMTTHYMDEADHLANRVGIVDHGQLIVEGTPEELVRGLGADVITIQGTGDATRFTAAASESAFVVHTSVQNSEPTHQVNQSSEQETAPDAEETSLTQLQFGVDNGDKRLIELLNLASAGGFHVQEVAVTRPSLGDAFLSHTGQALRD